MKKATQNGKKHGFMVNVGVARGIGIFLQVRIQLLSFLLIKEVLFPF